MAGSMSMSPGLASQMKLATMEMSWSSIKEEVMAEKEVVKLAPR
jgi:hypothetical protein